MAHINFIRSQLKMVTQSLEEMERKYAVGSIAMKSYLYPKILNLRKQKDNWIRKEEEYDKKPII